MEGLLERLSLQDRKQNSLSRADILHIHRPVVQEKATPEHELPHIFLKRLMALDYRARYVSVQQRSAEVCSFSMYTDCGTIDGNDDDNMDALLNPSSDFAQECLQENVHPMDVQMAVFHCSDSFLKQSMITKLSQCQYALPFLVPNPTTLNIECPLWTFRQITKTWKKTELRDNTRVVRGKSIPICKAETPLVSFLRFGPLSRSKSELMNTLINDRHKTFFHRNCSGSTKSRHLFDGVAEIAWYYPSGKPEDSFNDCVAFCNLHGDSATIKKQREILIEISSILVVFVPPLENRGESQQVLTTLTKSDKPVIFLLGDSNCPTSRGGQKKFRLGMKDKSNPDVCKALQDIIGEILSGFYTPFQLESVGKIPEVKVDENDKVCQSGKNAAMKIIKLIQGKDVAKIKDAFVPCQGQPWRDWCRTNKEKYHLRGNLEKEKSAKNQQLKQLRQKQCADSCTKMLKIFTDSLKSSARDEKEYFLNWTQFLIDELFTENLGLILREYNEKWSEVLALKRKHDKSDDLKVKQKELEHLSQKLQAATFGLEHIFREMAQMYEAHKSLKRQILCTHSEWVKYPELAADLMIAGHPMELMDGDAGHVPLTWISGLLQEVIKKLGDQRVFVLSVLGVQSSGKSTMLNAMFGLRFAVSAGRCTKGAYMQLLQLSEEIKEEYKSDYVLVVDTEGLRALELEDGNTLYHDNELATFVVGLANLTLINIFGENPAEMQDILQIVVQAFMRMKKVKLSPSCLFVHQNVTDIAASEKTMEGQRRLQEKLDKMTLLAAKEEGFDAECFSDVIEFDVQEDVKFFAQLWEGSPPMAPTNPGYSESIQELKSTILSKTLQAEGIKLSSFSSKIQDLWTALMNENFVFSFKNTQEIMAYRKLEVQYGNWTWALRSQMLTIENHLYLQIESGHIDKVEVSYIQKEMGKVFEQTKREMIRFFENDADKELLIQWQGQFLQKLKEFREELERGGKRKLSDFMQQKIARKKLDEQKMEYENKLLEKSRELVQELKGENEEKLKEHFNSVFSHWVTQLTSDTNSIEDIDLNKDQMTVLCDLGYEWPAIDESKSFKKFEALPELGDYSVYVINNQSKECYRESRNPQEGGREAKDIKKQHRVGAPFTFSFRRKTRVDPNTQQSDYQIACRNTLSHEEQEQIRSLVNNVKQQSLKIIQSKPVATMGYSLAYLQEIAKHVQEAVADFEAKKKLKLRKTFRIDLSLYVFDGTARWLLQSYKTYKDNNDAVSYLNSKRREYFSIFQNFCRGSSSAAIFAEMICEKLKVSATEAVCNQTAMDIAREMKCNVSALNGNRLNLEKHMLLYLAEEKNFEKYITYIKNPRKQVEEFIKREVNEYMFSHQGSEAQKILGKNVEDIKKLVSQALYNATETMKAQKGDLDKWVKQFSSSLDNNLRLGTIGCHNFGDIKDFGFLKEEIERVLMVSFEEMRCLSLEEVMRSRQKPDEILIEQLCNCCWERCPFCSAVCTNTLEGHSPEKHSVPFHRSTGVEGFSTRGTIELVVDFCTTLVSSDGSFFPTRESIKSIPYKLYSTAGEQYSSWSITADASITYWKWFVCTFKEDLENYYNLKFEGGGEIPSDWYDNSKEDAIDSLNDMYSF